MMALKVIGVALGLYAAYCGAVFFLQRQVLFPTAHIPQPPPSYTERIDRETIWLDMPFGQVESWYLPPVSREAGKPFPLLIFAHGNGDLIDYCTEEVRFFTRMGLGVLLVEYPGYGRSAGSPSQKTITETFVRAYDTMTARPEIDGSRIVLYGRSLGGGAVCQLAKNRQTEAMILISAFTSVKAFVSRYLVPTHIVRDPFNNLETVAAYPNPILILHGTEDTVVPYEHGVKLSKSARNAELISLHCGHNDMPINTAAFEDPIRDFLSRSGIINKTARD